MQCGRGDGVRASSVRDLKKSARESDFWFDAERAAAAQQDAQWVKDAGVLAMEDRDATA